MALRTDDVRPAASVGLLALVVLVVASWRAPAPAGVEPVVPVLALLTPGSASSTATAVLVILALGLLTGSWWQLVSMSRGSADLRPLGIVAAVWTVPLLAAPPLLSMDAYAYLAQGRMLVRGLDPYAGGPVLLGDDPFLGAMDPLWRASPVPYGPVALLTLRVVSLASGGVGSGVLLLRLLVLAGVIAAVAAALAMTPTPRRPLVLTLTALNPVTVVHLVGGGHVDALVAAGVGLAVLAVVRGRSRTAVLLASMAVAVKVVVLPVLLLAVVLASQRTRRLPVLVAVAALPFVVAALLLPHSWGFVDALRVPGQVVSWYAPASLVGALIDGAASVVGSPITRETALLTGRLVTFLVGAAGVVAILLRAAKESGAAPVATTVRRAGVVLLVVALTLPTMHAWYLGTALFLLAASGCRQMTRVLLVLSSGLGLSASPPLRDVDPLVIAVTWLAVGAVLVVAARTALRAPATAPPLVDLPALKRPLLVSVVLAPFAAVGLLAGSATAESGRPPPQIEAVRGTADLLTARLPKARVVRIVPVGPEALAVDLLLGRAPVCRVVGQLARAGLLPAAATWPVRDSSGAVPPPCEPSVLGLLSPVFAPEELRARNRPGQLP